MRNSSIFLGVVLAALGPSLCVVGYGMLASVAGEEIIDSISFAAVVLAISFTLTLALVLALGLPYALWLRSRGSLNLAQCLPGGGYCRRAPDRGMGAGHSTQLFMASAVGGHAWGRPWPSRRSRLLPWGEA